MIRLTLFDIENWREIGATLSRNKTRTFLTAFGIFWGTAMLAMLLGGEKGLERKLMSNFEGFATNCAVMEPGRRTISYQGFNKGSSWTLTTTDVDNLRRGIPELEALAECNTQHSVPMACGDKSTAAPVQGVSPEYPRIFLPVIYEGRFINAADESSARKVCVVGKEVAEKLFPGRSAVGEYLNVGGIFYKVVGMAGQTAEVQVGGSKIDQTVIVPMSTMRRAFHLGDNVGTAIIMARQGVSPTALRPRMERILRARHPYDPADSNALFFFDIAEQFEMVDSLFTGITILALFVGAGSLMAGVIGVGNIMWVIVKERTNEIGIRRAIGAKPSDIVSQILCEGMALTFFAGTAGISFATAVLYAAGRLFGPGFDITLDQVLRIELTFLVLGTAAGLIPALKAMKIKPIEAINDK